MNLHFRRPKLDFWSVFSPGGLCRAAELGLFDAKAAGVGPGAGGGERGERLAGQEAEEAEASRWGMRR